MKRMRLAFVNTFVSYGGAAIACNRLKKALSEKLLIAQFSADKQLEKGKLLSFIQGKYYLFILLIEKLLLSKYIANNSYRFAFSHSNIGSFFLLRKIKKFDIIHLHWFNQGFISLRGFEHIINSGKPIVWTLHDMWAFTGGCHYTDSCINYKKDCGNCFMLKNPSQTDLSNRIYKRKKNLYLDADITFVTCSKWLKESALESSLLKDKKVLSIPNPIDSNFYAPKEVIPENICQTLTPGSKKILFMSGNILDSRKGFKYLFEALKTSEFSFKVDLLLVGKLKKEHEFTDIPNVNIIKLGLISGEENIIDLYNLADVTVLPTLQDNLPNTIMESMACGTPCVAFNTGGIPEMIDHKKNGYVANYKSVEDLKNGILFLLENEKYKEFGNLGRKKVLSDYSNEKVAKQYYNLYESLLKNE